MLQVNLKSFRPFFFVITSLVVRAAREIGIHEILARSYLNSIGQKQLDVWWRHQHTIL